MLTVIILAAGALVAWRILSRHPLPDSWGAPLLHEDFADASWRDRWVPDAESAWQVGGGHAISTGPERALLILRRRLTPPVAVEYTARIIAGARPGDLSVWWSEREGVDSDPAAFDKDVRSWRIQAGAYENSYCDIFRLPGNERLAYNPLQLEPGRDYRFRVEIEGESMSMAIDGHEVLRCRDRFPTTSGHLALYAFFPDKQFGDVAVWQKPATAAVPAVATGDTLMAFGHYQDASTVYARLAEGAGPPAQQALFRQGIAERRLGHRDAARECWSRLADPALVQVAEALRLEDLALTGQYELFAGRLETQWRERPAVRDDLREQWQAAIARLASQPAPDAAVLTRLVDLRARLFSGDPASGFETTQALLALARFPEVLSGFPQEQRACLRALKGLGRMDEVRRSRALQPGDRIDIAFSTGDWMLAAEDPGVPRYHRAFCLCKAGRAAEVAGPDERLHPAMLYLGKAAELLQHRPLSGGFAREAMMALGRLEDAAGEGLPDVKDSGHDPTALTVLGRYDEAEKVLGRPLPWARLMQASEAGDAAAVARLRPLLRMPRDLLVDPWFAGMVIGPLVDRAGGGDAAGLRQTLTVAADGWGQVYAKCPWLLARYALGRCPEEELMTLPAVPERQAWLRIARALRAELAGDGPAALAAYRDYLALPMDQRLIHQNTLDPEVECCVRWRARVLAR